MVLLFWNKKVASVVYAKGFKSSVYTGFKVLWSMVYSHSNQIFFLLICKYPPLFGSFFGLFFFQSIVNREFLGVLEE